MMRYLALLLAASAAFAAASGVRAQTGQGFYKDKQITMLVSTGAGGGYDTYARTLARHITKHIPGNPTIVARNMPGADGAIAASALYNSTPRDGLTFAALTNGIAMDPLFGRFVGRFDAQRFSWIGSIGKLMNVCVTWETSAVKTIDDAKRREVIVSASGATSNSVMMPRIANQLLGTKFKVITGYTDPDVTLAVERGEVEGVCGLAYTTLKATRPQWFRDGRLNILLQIGLTKFPRSAQCAERARAAVEA